MSEENAGLTFIKTRREGIYVVEGDETDEVGNPLCIEFPLSFQGWRLADMGALKVRSRMPVQSTFVIRSLDINSVEYVS